MAKKIRFQVRRRESFVSTLLSPPRFTKTCLSESRSRRSPRFTDRLGWLFFFFFIIPSYAQDPVCQVLLEREQNNEAELVMRVGADKAGVYRYRIVNDDHAYVTGMFMNPMYKGKHLSKVFVYAMLHRHPKIKTVGALLVIDNLKASGLLWAPKNVTQEQCIFGASQTPFAKAFAHYGFRVTACKWNPATTYLQVEVTR